MPSLVELIRGYAMENYYRHSWDIVATRWSNADIATTIEGAKTRRGALAKTWGRLQTIDAARSSSRRPVKPVSLLEFLAIRGLRPHGDLTYILDGNPVIRRRSLLRETGFTLDRAREACVEAGYLQDTPWEGGVSTSTINDLLDAIAAEIHGTKLYPMGQEPVTAVEIEENPYE